MRGPGPPGLPGQGSLHSKRKFPRPPTLRSAASARVEGPRGHTKPIGALSIRFPTPGSLSFVPTGG
jgi:hypothetical protein